jgi:hypothetical protein
VPQLWPSILLREPGGLLRTAALAAAQAVFLWMFLASDPLEQLAAAGAFGPDPDVRDAAFAFAAAWRHGMAGNSLLYMPGFFAVAAASWIWSETSAPRGSTRFAASVLAALAAAWACTAPGAAAVIAGFGRQTVPAAVTIPAPQPYAIAAGLYTLLTWSAFVIGARLSLVRRSMVPLLPVPVLTAGLVALRPWTVDEFASTWARRSADGDPVAVVSALAVPTLAACLALSRPGRPQARSDGRVSPAAARNRDGRQAEDRVEARRGRREHRREQQ